MTNAPPDAWLEPPSPAPREPLRPGGPWTALALAASAVILVAIAARTTAADHQIRQAPAPEVGTACAVPGSALRLPPGHPPVAAWPALPPGHPPVGYLPAPRSPLPAGHPPVGVRQPAPPAFPPGFMVEI